MGFYTLKPRVRMSLGFTSLDRRSRVICLFWTVIAARIVGLPIFKEPIKTVYSEPAAVAGEVSLTNQPAAATGYGFGNSRQADSVSAAAA